MRHATAADPGGIPDAQRPLSDQGRREAREAGEALRGRHEEIDLVLSSPRLRARETAEILVQALGGTAAPEVRESLSCGATSESFRTEIEARPAAKLLLVAHNPELSAFASGLVGQPVSFRPGTMCAIDLDSDGGRLIWLRHP